MISWLCALLHRRSITPHIATISIASQVWQASRVLYFVSKGIYASVVLPSIYHFRSSSQKKIPSWQPKGTVRPSSPVPKQSLHHSSISSRLSYAIYSLMKLGESLPSHLEFFLAFDFFRHRTEKLTTGAFSPNCLCIVVCASLTISSGFKPENCRKGTSSASQGISSPLVCWLTSPGSA